MPAVAYKDAILRHRRYAFCYTPPSIVTKRTKYLLWTSVGLLLVAELMMLLIGRNEGVRPEARAGKSPLPVTRMTEQRTRPVVVVDPPSTEEVPESPPTATAAADPLPIDALKQRLQSANAVPNEALLTFRSPQAYAAFVRFGATGGVVVKDRLDDLLTARVGFESLEQLRSQLLNGGGDAPNVGANYLVDVPRVPPTDQREGGGDAPFGDTVLASIGINAEVDRSQWGAGITVAVVDSGVGDHPTFREGQVTHIDLVKDGKPFEGHGTAIASLIAGNMDGAQGVAPAANILDIRVANSEGDSDSFTLARGITTAIDRGAKVINVSMGSYGDAAVVRDAVQKAIDRGITVVAAAGNEQSATMAWPAAYEGVISVSGVDAKDQIAYFSNTGNPTLAAPAVGIPSAYYRDNKAYLATGNGTSQSAALVSGASAVIAGRGGNVPLTLTRSAFRMSLAPQYVGVGMLRVPQTR